MSLFAPNAPCDRRSAGGRAWAHAWQALRTPIGSYREPPVVAPAGYGSFPTAVAGLGATEVLVSASRLSLLRAHGGSPLVGMVIAAGAVSGGHLIPVICSPACSMRRSQALPTGPGVRCIAALARRVRNSGRRNHLTWNRIGSTGAGQIMMRRR